MPPLKPRLASTRREAFSEDLGGGRMRWRKNTGAPQALVMKAWSGGGATTHTHTVQGHAQASMVTKEAGQRAMMLGRTSERGPSLTPPPPTDDPAIAAEEDELRIGRKGEVVMAEERRVRKCLVKAQSKEGAAGGGRGESERVPTAVASH
ncbi:hypothetical protein NQZ68_038826 [Dissostichus eleginoides]|nr:hypothetical protein NQZ68_038826 [Dissostichus eleginoides]